jgi:hypothetical protein
MAQQEVLGGLLGRVGFVAPVIVNLRTDQAWGRDRHVETMVDGHLRVQLALSRDEETPVPVVYVDLTPEEETAILATLDPVGDLAGTDHEKLAALVEHMPDDLRQLTAVLREEGKRLVGFEATETYRIIVECDSAEAQGRALAQLQAEGYTCWAG